MATMKMMKKIQLTVSCFLLLFHFTISVQTPLKSHNLFNIAASIKSTHEALSLHHNPPPEEQQVTEEEVTETTTTTTNSSSYYSVTIHPRISLHTPPHHRHETYKSLTQSRLTRDTSRVTSLLTKLKLTQLSISNSDLKPAEAQYATEAELVTPVTSGSSMGSGEYFARLGIGRPSVPYYLVLDTGSDVTWLQCDPCSSCYQQSDPIYKPSSSTTYTPINCKSPLCTRLEISACPRTGTDCLYQVSYGDGSFTVGNFILESLSFGKYGGSSLEKVAMGCGHDNEGLFVASAGLLGLGGGGLSLTSQIKATSFSYCLVDRDSGKSSTLNFNSPHPGGSITTHLLKDGSVDTFYYVGLTGMSVGGHPLSISPSLFASGGGSGGGGVIVDSGTAITRLPTEAYESLRDAFVKMAPNLPKTDGVALFDTCYDLSGMKEARVPTVGFRFDGGNGEELSLPAKNYLIPVDDKGTFCFAFAPTSSGLSIIGNVQQQGIRVHYDLLNQQVFFTENSC